MKQSLRNIGGAHTLKALESFANQPDNKLANPAANLANEKQESPDIEPHEPDLTMPSPDKLKRGGRGPPVYVKHGYPDVMPHRTDYHSFLPKIPGANDNYGMVYNKPETEAEKNMHELWLARRKQEVSALDNNTSAFDYMSNKLITM